MPKSRTIENLAVATGFPVVCMGMSSGGLPPLIMLLDKLSPDTGMAFVVIHHLLHSPTFLPAILSRHTLMPVELASAESPLEPNHVYILPSGKEIRISDGVLRLRPLSKTRGWSNVVTLFLQSLAESGRMGIAVILSGIRADGAAALETLQAHRGIAIVQDLGTADPPEMPTAALKTGCLDYILRPETIAAQLQKIGEQFRSWLVASAVRESVGE